MNSRVSLIPESCQCRTVVGTISPSPRGQRPTSLRTVGTIPMARSPKRSKPIPETAILPQPSVFFPCHTSDKNIVVLYIINPIILTITIYSILYRSVNKVNYFDVFIPILHFCFCFWVYSRLKKTKIRSI